MMDAKAPVAKDRQSVRGTQLAKPLPAYVDYLPGIAFTTAAGFLAGGTYLGIRMGLKRGMRETADTAEAATTSRTPSAKVVDPVIDARAAYNYRLPNGNGMTAGQLGARAFLYGTALCLAGSGVLGLATCWYLDTWTLDSFARRMEQLVPQGRQRLEAVLDGPLSSVTSSSRSFADSVKGTVGASIASHVPAIKGLSKEEEAAGLTARDKRLLEEFRSVFEEDQTAQVPAAASVTGQQGTTSQTAAKAQQSSSNPADRPQGPLR